MKCDICGKEVRAATQVYSEEGVQNYCNRCFIVNELEMDSEMLDIFVEFLKTLYPDEKESTLFMDNVDFAGELEPKDWVQFIKFYRNKLNL